MIAAMKNYLTAKLTAAGMDGPVYLDVSDTKRHKRPPWATVLTPEDRKGLDLTRVDKRINRNFDEESDAYLEIIQIFEAGLNLDVVVCAKDLATAETLNTAFLTGLDKHIYLDPAHEAGWFTDLAEVASDLNQSVLIEVTGAVLSDTVAAIKQETQILNRLVITGGILKEKAIPALPGVETAFDYKTTGGN